MHGDQDELARRRRVHPGQLPGHPESGLIEVRDVSGHQRFDDGIDRRCDDPGDLRRHRGDRARDGAQPNISPSAAAALSGTGTGHATGT
jgi:hypothetical protein